MCEKKCKNKSYRCVTHCIFDLDGTIINTETVYAQIFEEMLKERGLHYSVDLRKKIMGTTTESCWQTLTTELHIKEPLQSLVEDFRKRGHDRLGNCALMPGAEKLLRHLHDHKIPLAIATSSAEPMFVHKTQQYRKLFEVFHHVVCGGTDPQVKRSKPNPDIFLICAERFEDNPCPLDCLVFEDSPQGVIAASKAGMQCVATPDKDVPRSEFKTATMILNSLEEFSPERFGLPCYFMPKDTDK